MPAVAPVHFYFDYVDPGSFLVERILSSHESDGTAVERVPFEATPPPGALADPGSAEWQRFWGGAVAMAAEEGVTLAHPRIVPWTRKAHELALHALEEGRLPEVHLSLFEAFLLEGRDVGRVDVLLELAVRHGLDLTRAKAVLDVDRHTPAVEEARAAAERLGVRGVPTLLVGDRRLEGFRGHATTLAFLHGHAHR